MGVSLLRKRGWSEGTFAVSKKQKTASMDTKIVGNKIAKARKEADMSQADLAQRLFISPQAVGKWERGESVPDIITMTRLAEILGVDLNYFSEKFASTASEATVKTGADSRGDLEVATQATSEISPSGERSLLTDLSASDLRQSDLAGVAAHKMKFHGSALRGSSFAGADLTGSSFSGSDIRETDLSGADLTDCSFTACDLSDAKFSKTILVRTEFTASGLTRAKFTDARLIDVKLSKTDLRTTVFENCVFEGVDFEHSDMRGLCLDGQAFTGVRFDKTMMSEVTFKGATLKNVSFRSSFALTNRYYRAIKTICFDEAMMDKLTYAALKGLGAELSKVTLV